MTPEARFLEIMDEMVEVRTAQLVGLPDHQSDITLHDLYKRLSDELYMVVVQLDSVYITDAFDLVETVAKANAVNQDGTSFDHLAVWLSGYIDGQIEMFGGKLP